MVIPQDFGLNRGPQATDIRHNFSTTAVAELPFGKGKRWARSGMASKLAGGWQLSAIVTAHSGLPFTAVASAATLNAPNSGQFADCLSKPNKLGNILQWYDKSAFAGASVGTLWNLRDQ